MKPSEVLEVFNEQNVSDFKPAVFRKDEFYELMEKFPRHNLIIMEANSEGTQFVSGYNDYDYDEDSIEYQSIEDNPVAMEVLERVYDCRKLLQEPYRYCVFDQIAMVGILIILQDLPKFNCNYLVMLSYEELSDLRISSENFKPVSVEEENQPTGVLGALMELLKNEGVV